MPRKKLNAKHTPYKQTTAPPVSWSRGDRVMEEAPLPDPTPVPGFNKRKYQTKGERELEKIENAYLDNQYIIQRYNYDTFDSRPEPQILTRTRGPKHRYSEEHGWTVHDESANPDPNQYIYKRLRYEQDLAPGADGQLAGQPMATQDTTFPGDDRGGLPLDADLNNILNQNDVELLKTQKHTFLLPALDETPKTCEANCAEINKIKREQCAILRKRVLLWLKKNNCPSSVKPTQKKERNNNNNNSFYDATSGRTVYTNFDENGAAQYSFNRNGPWQNKDEFFLSR